MTRAVALLFSCLAIPTLAIACTEPPRDVTSVALPTTPAGSVAPTALTTDLAGSAELGTLVPAASPVSLDETATWNGRWPLPATAMPRHASGPDGFTDSAQVCTNRRGDPGITVNGKECHNPCPAGGAPITWQQCSLICKTDADCTRGGRRGTCSLQIGNAMLCERPNTLECDGGALSTACTAASGEPGQQCPGKPECEHADFACRDGKKSFGYGLGQRCARPCESDADCPEGKCEHSPNLPRGRFGECAPGCPGEGCPVRD